MRPRGAFYIETPVLPPRQSATLISRLAPLLNRPLLLGAAMVLASLIFCGTLVQTGNFSEVKASGSAPGIPSPAQHRALRTEELSPLFLALLGLAALALSQLRPSEQPPQRKIDSYAGKNVAAGQKLPDVREPQPPLVLGSGVVAREHHDDVVGLEAVACLRMLHK